MTKIHPLLSAIQNLYETQLEMVLVTHEPWTERYERAEDELERVLFDGKAIGFKKSVSVDEPGYEVVIWNVSENDEIYGIYSVIRVIATDFNNVTVANLFCFYDGKDPSSKKFKTENAARQYMRSFGLYEELNNA